MIAARLPRWQLAARLALGLGVLSACRPEAAPEDARAAGLLERLFAPPEGLSLSELGLYSDVAQKDGE